MDLSHIFDRCVVINLDRRPDRLELLKKKLSEIDWPFAELEIVSAIDGNKVRCPKWYRSGGGAWGCARTHLRILEDAQMAGQSVLILEDDAYFAAPSSFRQDCEAFFSKVPDNWSQVMLGGQHMGQQSPISDGVVKCVNTQRTHAYGVRGPAVADLYELWTNTVNHIDWVFPQHMANHPVYAPDPFLIGQDASKSDINNADNPRKLWRQPRETAPVYWFRNTPRETIESLRTKGFHFGRQRDTRGEDVGLDPIWREGNVRLRPTKLRTWISMIDWESASEELLGTSIWSEKADETLIREVCGKRLVELDNPSVDDAVAALKEHGGSA